MLATPLHDIHSALVPLNHIKRVINAKNKEPALFVGGGGYLRKNAASCCTRWLIIDSAVAMATAYCHLRRRVSQQLPLVHRYAWQSPWSRPLTVNWWLLITWSVHSRVAFGNLASRHWLHCFATPPFAKNVMAAKQHSLRSLSGYPFLNGRHH